MSYRVIQMQENICDRCSKTSLVDIGHRYDHNSSHEENLPFGWYSLRGMAAEDLIRDTYIDFCQDCCKSFDRWYREKINGKKD